MRVTAPVAAALRMGWPVVALESSVFAQGLPAPANREAAGKMMRAIEELGAVAAITAVVNGVPTAGLTAPELARFLERDGIAKISARDIAPAVAQSRDGATTVAASLVIARLAGIPVFATGGIGGVHRGTPVDESADLLELSRSPLIVVCAGVKAILDVTATVERLETLGIAVVGYRTDRFPLFYSAGTGTEVRTRADTPGEIVAIFRAQSRLGRTSALLVVQPPPPRFALKPALVEGAVELALGRARERGITGAAITPFLLAGVERATSGRSLTANLALLERNAELAAEIAVALAPVRRPRKSR